MKLSKYTLYRLSVLTLLGFSAFGIGIIYCFQEVSLREALLGGQSWTLQMACGLIYGFGAAFLALLLIQSRLMNSVTGFYKQLFSGLQLNLEDIIFYSFCAGVGEEVFFRAGLQPFFGIWPVAIFFIMIHGYLDPRNWRMMIYGIVMVFITAGMGYLFENMGLIAAAAAHFAFDLAMFFYLVFHQREQIKKGTIDW